MYNFLISFDLKKLVLNPLRVAPPWHFWKKKVVHKIVYITLKLLVQSELYYTGFELHKVDYKIDQSCTTDTLKISKAQSQPLNKIQKKN